MKSGLKSYTGLLLSIIFIFSSASTLKAQDGPPEWEFIVIRSVEKMLDSKGRAQLEIFIDQYMILGDDAEREELVNQISEIRSAMRGLRDDISVEGLPDGALLIMSSGEVEKQLKITFDYKAKLISKLELQEAPAPLDLDITSLNETFDQLEKDGLAGIVYLKVGQEVVIKRAFGMANKELEIPNKLSTIFGTGSRPIDYTLAAIQLLDQEGKINIDDTIDKYFSDAPEDKSTMTVRHLMTGRSGLPDFFHTADDWDADLAWIDRSTAIQRLLSQELLFESGTDRSHSHGAFGLLAALIELVTEHQYYEFIHERFFIPAGMTRTGEYGKKKEFQIRDFAEGGGPQKVGIPNIPPNWGPTSWLIKGSGGMFSSLDDLMKFYGLVRSNKVLDNEHNQIFRGPTVNLDGSDRGFELLSAYFPPGRELYLFLNHQIDRAHTRQLMRAMEKLVEPDE